MLINKCNISTIGSRKRNTEGNRERDAKARRRKIVWGFFRPPPFTHSSAFVISGVLLRFFFFAAMPGKGGRPSYKSAIADLLRIQLDKFGDVLPRTRNARVEILRKLAAWLEGESGNPLAGSSMGWLFFCGGPFVSRIDYIRTTAAGRLRQYWRRLPYGFAMRL